MFVRKILHVLKDSDLSLNMWFRRRNMGYAKSLKEKIWTHEGPSTKRKKNDEHMKAHVLKKKKRDHIYKRSIVLVYLFHTHAHLDLRVWHFSPWILDLTLQHMQYKYAILYTPT